ncbi:WhiB family transcriptional regulator [Streptomyces sp. 8N706]|uniref:WhiB family transcriptional regulator n=1 Tax=Streptomyces sp. 8N706 TaxID=3457416 RepID=UPI003FCEEDB4
MHTIVRTSAYGPVSTAAPARPRPACADEDPELFFPIGNTGPALFQIEEAKVVCGRCPVMEQCLQWALENNEHSGVWGGLSEDERRAMKRRAARKRAGAARA